MSQEPSYIAFSGVRRVAAGDLLAVLPILKQRFDADQGDLVLVFDEESGRQVDFDLRGTFEDVRERAVPSNARGPGRPKLGVVSREITLLPRHWQWLQRQTSGASSTLRKLVEHAMAHEPAEERALQIRSAMSGFLSAMAGDRPNYEEATRALFAGDLVRFDSLIARWPKDIRDYAMQRAREAAYAGS